MGGGKQVYRWWLVTQVVNTPGVNSGIAFYMSSYCNVLFIHYYFHHILVFSWTSKIYITYIYFLLR